MVIVIIMVPKVHSVGNAVTVAPISITRTKEQIQYHLTYLNSNPRKDDLVILLSAHIMKKTRKRTVESQKLKPRSLGTGSSWK